MNTKYVLVFAALAPALLAAAESEFVCRLPLVSPRDAQRLAYASASANAELVAPSTRRRTVPSPANGSATTPPIVNFIDSEIFSTMSAASVVPTKLSSDEEFLRRVTLDLTGQIPDATTVQTFIADTATDKRTKKIDALLASDAFNDRWTMWLGDLVQNVQASTSSREYYQGRNAYYTFLRDSIRTAKPYDQTVREILAGKGDSFTKGESNYWVRQIQRNGPIQDTYDNLSAHSGERFLGMPLLCISCHNGFGHLESVNQYLKSKSRSNFWANAAFFARTRAVASAGDPTNPNVRKFDVEDTAVGSYNLNTDSGNKTPRSAAPGQPTTVSPAFILTGETPRAGEPWRDAYGRMLTADPQFARATVNYLWKEMFGVGIVEPANAFDLNRLDPATLPPGQTLQPTHPALLSRLATEFVSDKFDLRAILRTMAMSSTYQLSSQYTPGVWNEAWTPYFARHYPHRLTAEEMLDAIARSTNVPVSFTVQGLGTVTASMKLPDTIEGPRQPAGMFLDEFGRGDRDDVARTNDTSITQALSLMNNTVVTTRVRRSTANSTVAKVLASTTDPASVADQLYLATLSRHPSATEKQQAIDYLKSGTLATKTEDLQFVLLNSLEFLFD
jgi:hypothetical protein